MSLSEQEKRLKRLTFRAEHRGIRELDILVGGFARRHLATLSETELAQFETILSIPDQTLYAILRGEEPLPSGLAWLENNVLQRMRAETTGGSLVQKQEG